MKNKVWMKRVAVTSVALTMIVPALAACSSGDKSSSTEKRVLRIGTLYGSTDSESYFRQQYTDMFEFSHPNIELEIVPAINQDDQRFKSWDPDEPQKEEPDPYEEYKKLLTGENPVDVVVMEYNYLKRFVQDNLLKQLDPLIQKDKFDISDYVPTVIDGIKQVGDDSLYALSPTFSSSALFYNKKLFQDAGVTFPTDNMFWPDVIDLASRVAKGEGKDRKYGFMFQRWPGSYGIYDVTNYASALQLKMWDDKGEKMLVNSSSWENALSTVAKLYKDDITPDQDDINKVNESNSSNGGYNPLDYDWFLSGRTAMVLAEYGYVNEIQMANASADTIKGFTPFEWDVVTFPQFQEAVGVGGNMSLNQLMGINAQAQNADDAWEFVKFSNSRELAKLKSRSQYDLSARKEFLKPADGSVNFNAAAFYTLKPAPPASTDQEALYRTKPGIYEAQYPGDELFNAVIKGTKTVKEALAEWETKGNEVLTRIKTNVESGSGTSTDVKISQEEAVKTEAATTSSTEASVEG
ncbi:ABC transporter substrate-binding protein [Paenibacillus xylaniclasticus]|uniref:ABC transporter substrate-binding protein n=1 Tax=Paenibacillus xylaniclasticus TaxID=588083 RepID=UPI000FDA96E2|nr:MULTISPECIES: extracellular solute-binding protein [Paenibacillus]GFN30434.1 ABC transporter substrate-binding protein [Paenibacillus curdlanolyticus]